MDSARGMNESRSRCQLLRRVAQVSPTEDRSPSASSKRSPQTLPEHLLNVSRRRTCQYVQFLARLQDAAVLERCLGWGRQDKRNTGEVGEVPQGYGKVPWVGGGCRFAVLRGKGDSGRGVSCRSLGEACDWGG